MTWEPGGSDFLSPCLEEAALMKRILSKDEFKPLVRKIFTAIKE